MDAADTMRKLADMARAAGVAHNGGAGDEWLLCGRPHQWLALVGKMVDANPLVAELREHIEVDEKLLRHRAELLAAIPPCAEHGAECVPHAIQWVEWAKESDARWSRMLSKRVEVEQMMFDAARGKRPMPGAQELREWALRLGQSGGDDLASLAAAWALALAQLIGVPLRELVAKAPEPAGPGGAPHLGTFVTGRGPAP